MLVKPADILGFLGVNNGGTQGRSRNSLQTLMRVGVAKGMLTANPRAYYYQLAAVTGWTSLLRLHRLRQRTLILAGDSDTLVRPYNATVLRRAIGDAQVHMLKGEGHFFVATSAGETAGLIRDFL